jgi:hypothetical protein
VADVAPLYTMGQYGRDAWAWGKPTGQTMSDVISILYCVILLLKSLAVGVNLIQYSNVGTVSR